MDIETTTSTGNSGSVSALDQITALLSEPDVPVVTTEAKPAKAKKTAPEIDESEDSTDEDERTGEEAEEDEGEVSDEPSEEDEEEEEATWANTLGIDDKQIVLDEKGNLSGINVKIDGKTSAVAVKDLIAGYQSNKSNTNKSKALADERREFEAIRGNVAQEYTKKIETVTKLTDHLKQSLLSDYTNIDWNRLRVENPGEYAAAVQDYNLRTAEIEKVMAAVGEEKNTVTTEQTVEQQKVYQEYLRGQAEKIIENNPSWAKPEVFKKAAKQMQEFIEESYGFTQAEFDNIQDARILEIVKDAMAYRAGTKIAKTKLEVVKPKFQKSKGTTVKQTSRLEQLTKTAKSTSGYAKRVAEQDAIAELLSGII
jgi:hypothetical protein